MSGFSSKRRRAPKHKIETPSMPDESLCFLCRKNAVTSFKDIGQILAPASGKSIKNILLSLTSLLEPERKLPEDKPICQSCYKDVVDYDEYVFMSEAVKRRITQYLNQLEKYCADTETDFVFTEFLDEPAKVAEELLSEPSNVTDDIPNEPPVALADGCDYGVYGCLAEPEMPVSDLLEIKDEFPDLSTEEIENFDSPPATPSKRKPKLICNNCNKRFKSKIQLQKHIAEQHKATIYPICGICGMVARDDEYLDLHMNLHEGKTENECRYCDKRYTRKKSVIRHMQKHWDKQQFQCDKCGLRFSETTVLYNHRLQHEAMEEPLICSVCQRVFKTKRTYNAHMITHRADRPRYSCAHCPKTFVEKYTLKVHLRLHEQTDEPHEEQNVKQTKTKRPAEHNCVICGCRFGTMDCYEFHMQKEHDVVMREGGGS